MTTDFMEKVVLVSDIMSSMHPFAERYKAPVTKYSFPAWVAKCQELVSYLFDLEIRMETCFNLDNERLLFELCI